MNAKLKAVETTKAKQVGEITMEDMAYILAALMKAHEVACAICLAPKSPKDRARLGSAKDVIELHKDQLEDAIGRIEYVCS